MPKNKLVQAATMKLEIELRCSECNSPLCVNNVCTDIYGSYCYIEPCEECMSRRTQRAPDVCPVCNGKGSIRVGVYSENCEACNGTGKRR